MMAARLERIFISLHILRIRHFYNYLSQIDAGSASDEIHLGDALQTIFDIWVYYGQDIPR